MKAVKDAMEFARLHHRGQMYGKFPYFWHITDTVKVAEQLMLSEKIQVACALHDILEDTPLSYNDIFRRFDRLIADIVYNVTDELGKTRKERKERTYPKIRTDPNAILVKFCDRIANVRHSKEHNESMYMMYKNENAKFIEQITKGITFTSDIRNAMVLLNKVIKS